MRRRPPLRDQLQQPPWGLGDLRLGLDRVAGGGRYEDVPALPAYVDPLREASGFVRDPLDVLEVFVEPPLGVLTVRVAGSSPCFRSTSSSAPSLSTSTTKKPLAFPPGTPMLAPWCLFQ